ncbi:hypothetical protein AMATHDRAFT_69294 [Amanita thiersii Skay4041]|uniref:F-box domain-containing protein n=1 Tax=Amanita thiersii Skay4041 TaxID=703135 RepID=A0A2A9NBG6_9AGAR|nr:hypothetical protein AMATHDRAFT_69294 [Amanita thiersii Skay4041]
MVTISVLSKRIDRLRLRFVSTDEGQIDFTTPQQHRSTSKHDRLQRLYDVHQFENLSPCMKLPDDVLHDIFSLLAEQVILPLQEKPVALVLSHVCSLWRTVALNTPTLWTDVAINFYPAKEDDIHAWLSYASQWLISISILGFLSDSDFKQMIHSIALRYRLKRLMVHICFKQLEIFLSEVKSETLEGLELRCGRISQHFAPLFPLDNCPFPSLMSFHLDSITHPLDIHWFYCLPWNSLRYLWLNTRIPLPSLLQCLKQTSELISLNVLVSDDVGRHLPSGKIILPHLSHLRLRIAGSGVQYPFNVLSHLIHPNLQTLHLRAPRIHWDSKLFSDLSCRSNFSNLQKLEIVGGVSHDIPIDLLLKDVPQLCELRLHNGVLVDIHMLVGLLTGEVGSNLTFVGRLHCLNLGQLLTMVEERLKTSNRTGQDTTPTRSVLVRYAPDWRHLQDRVAALTAQGIDLILC